MEKLTEKQIEDVIRWMNNWVQLAGTGIPIRFKEDYIKRLNLACVVGRSEQYCINCGGTKLVYNEELTECNVKCPDCS